MIPATQTSVYDVLTASAQTYAGRPLLNVLSGTAQVYDIPQGEITFANAFKQVENWVLRFQKAEYKAGIRVALLLENRPDFFIIWMALNRIGASVVPVNPDLRASELQYVIGHAEPALILTTAPRLAEVRAAALTAGVCLQVITAKTPIPAPRREAVTAKLSDDPCVREAALLYTSGTTGAPKGCILSNRYFLEIGRWYASLGGLISLSTKSERMITPLPIFHMNAMAYSFVTMLAIGGSLTVLDRFHPKRWWRDVGESRATCLHYLGLMPSVLMGLPARPEDRNHTVRFGFGAGVDAKIQSAFEHRFGFPLVEAWAMTETGAGAVLSNHRHNRLTGCSALGQIPEFLSLRIADEKGAPVVQGQSGELLVKRKGAMPKLGFFSAYYKDTTATENAWKDGWFHTGDIVRMDRQGFVFFVDRQKNIIRRSGENIAAVEVESILMLHPDVTAAAVAPVPDLMRGDEVFACLTVAEPSIEKATEIVVWALDQMAYYKVPGFVAFVRALPLTSTQKIQRAKVHKLALELLKDPGTVSTRHLKKRRVL